MICVDVDDIEKVGSKLGYLLIREPLNCGEFGSLAGCFDVFKIITVILFLVVGLLVAVFGIVKKVPWVNTVDLGVWVRPEKALKIDGVDAAQRADFKIGFG